MCDQLEYSSVICWHCFTLAIGRCFSVAVTIIKNDAMLYMYHVIFLYRKIFNFPYAHWAYQYYTVFHLHLPPSHAELLSYNHDYSTGRDYPITIDIGNGIIFSCLKQPMCTALCIHE